MIGSLGIWSSSCSQVSHQTIACTVAVLRPPLLSFVTPSRHAWSSTNFRTRS